MGTTARDPGGRPATKPSTPRRLGAWLLWFAVAGGSVAWAVHLMAAWGVVELACVQGNRRVAGLSLRGFVGVATIVPGLVAMTSLAAAWWLHSRWLHAGGAGSRGEPGGDRTARELDRARFMAQIGFWANVFAVLMIVFGGLAVVVIPPCVT